MPSRLAAERTQGASGARAQLSTTSAVDLFHWHQMRPKAGNYEAPPRCYARRGRADTRRAYTDRGLKTFGIKSLSL